MNRKEAINFMLDNPFVVLTNDEWIDQDKEIFWDSDMDCFGTNFPEQSIFPEADGLSLSQKITEVSYERKH